MSELNVEEAVEKLDTIDFRKLAWNTELANNVNSLKKFKLYSVSDGRGRTLHARGAG